MIKFIRLITLVISIATAASGAIQMIKPSFVLGLVGGESSATSNHFFGIIGMFMLLFGCMMIHALYNACENKAAVLWSALQKLGASLAVFLGIYHQLFSPIAALVAGFDFISFILFLIYYRMIPRLN